MSLDKLSMLGRRFVVLLLTSWVSQSWAGAFLKVRPHTQKEVGVDVVQQTFAAALDMDAAALQQFEEELRPMYIALPMNQHGALEPKVVHYALHRYFVQKHGWYMKGLEPSGNASSASTPAGILKDRVPEYMQQLLEAHMEKDDGWQLHELAICSAALSALIQREFVQDLEFVYGVLGRSTTDVLDFEQMRTVLDTYLAQYLLEEDFKDHTFEGIMSEVKETYSGWGDMSMWLRDVESSLDFEQAAFRNPFVNTPSGASFDRVASIIQEVMHRYTSIQNLECSALTEALLDIEHKGTGRVPLADFYKAGLGDKWKFWEPQEYLRHVGALDETDPQRPSLIIPNYVHGMNNCLASSSYFSVCCPNKCERLVGHLEHTLAAPIASPQRIAEVVSHLPSDSVDAPRNLSTSLLSRLSEMAEHQKGQVQIHSRLFSQWMHHAYPRECSYPHVESMENTLTPEEWAAHTGMDFAVTEEEARAHVRQHSRMWEEKKVIASGEELPWVAFDELIGSQHPQPKSRLARWGRKAAAILIVAAVAAPVLRLWHVAVGSMEPKDERHVV